MGAIVGGVIGFFIAGLVSSPKFKYIGGGWVEKSGGMRFMAKLVTYVVFIALGAAVGLFVAGG